MVGGEWPLGKKIRNEELWEKNEKGEGKREENYIKNGGKGFKNASFRVVNCKISRGGLPTPIQPPCRRRVGPGMRIRFWPKTGSGSLYLKLREILNSLLNEYVR